MRWLCMLAMAQDPGFGHMYTSVAKTVHVAWHIYYTLHLQLYQLLHSKAVDRKN